MSASALQDDPNSAESMVVNEYTMRLLIGLIALLLPALVYIWASFQVHDSISWSYHTNARDIFVGSLAIMGCALICYKGHNPNPIDMDDKTSFADSFKLWWEGKKPFLLAMDTTHFWRTLG